MTICPVPAAGIFETLLVSDGRPVELDAHLARLEASLGIVFGAPLPRGSGQLVCEHAAGVGHGRLRVTVGPAGIAVRVTEVPVEALFPGWERALWLRPLTVQGGIGAHKWADRTLLEAAEGRAGAGELPLVVDGDGTVLEASRGNVFLVADGTLVTPRADGRLLPGITRRRVLALAEDAGVEVREDVVTLAELLAADEVFLTGAVRGIEHVCGCDGGARWHTGPTASLLAERLQRLWNGIPEKEATR